MQDRGQTGAATAVVAITGVLWGLYWLPVRRLEDLGLSGALGTLAIVAAAAVLLAPVALRAPFRRGDAAAAGFVALGGAAFALYSVGFVHGRVAVIILLWFLTPVWSVLIARFVLGRPVAPLRIAAIAVGLAGLGLMLGAGGGLPWPRGPGEWMALAAGMLWSVATTGMAVRPPLAPVPAAFVFALGACGAAGAIALALPGAPVAVVAPGQVMALALLTGVLWWAASIAALLWATARLEPVRVGILLMTEVLVGAATAAVLAGERLSAMEFAGGGLVLIAGLLEVWPVRSRPRT